MEQITICIKAHMHAQPNPTTQHAGLCEDWPPIGPVLKPLRHQRGGGVFARRATFVETILTFNPDLPSSRRAPKSTKSGPQTFPTKDTA